MRGRAFTGPLAALEAELHELRVHQLAMAGAVDPACARALDAEIADVEGLLRGYRAALEVVEDG